MSIFFRIWEKTLNHLFFVVVVLEIPQNPRVDIFFNTREGLKGFKTAPFFCAMKCLHYCLFNLSRRDRVVNSAFLTYTCQLFLRYKREIFILGVLGFLKTTRSFPKIPVEVRSLPKTSEVCRSLPKASSLPVLFTSKIRDREEGIAICSFYTWFSFLTWVWVDVFLEIVSSRTATTHIFQSGVRNWPAGVSRRETHA